MVMSVKEAFDIAVEYYSDHPDELAALRKLSEKAWYKVYKRLYDIRNKEKVAAQGKAYYNNNKEACDARNKAWKAANPDKVKASNKAWAAANPDKVKASNKAWAAANPDHRKSYSKNISDETWQEVYKHLGTKCSCPTCTWSSTLALEVDHIIPRKLGLHKDAPRAGVDLRRYIIKNNCWGDFQLLCRNCNMLKHRNGGTCNCGNHSGNSKLLP